MGASFQVRNAGDASKPTLIMLHGITGHAEAYVRNLRSHAEHFSCWAIDFIGHGYSVKPNHPLEVKHYIEQVIAFLDAIGVEKAYFTGESLGGWVTAQLAIDHPERGERIVLNTMGGTMANPQVMERLYTLSMEAAKDPSWDRVKARLEWLMADPTMVTDDLIKTRQATSSSFTTVTPGGVIFPSFEPPPDRGTVGVGHPISVIFDKPPPDKAAAERALTVTTVPAQVGGWYWVDERTVHYRPQVYWQAGTQVTVDAKVYGVDPGRRVLRGNRPHPEPDHRAVEGRHRRRRHQDMTVTIDGQVARQFPVSMGRDESITVDGEVISFVTPSGIYVAQEKYDVKQMNSAHLRPAHQLRPGYDQAIPLAVRLSNSGIFAHSAPWSVADQGIRNVSHGCINMPPDDAQWFYDTFSYGDIVQVTGTSTQLAPDDGYGDWNIPWDQWVQGSALT